MPVKIPSSKMINIRNVFVLGVLAINLSNGCCHTLPSDNYVERIFLPNTYNLTDITRILLSAKESFSALRDFEDETDMVKKFSFAQNYANHLWELLNAMQTKNLDVYQIFHEGNLFLQGNKSLEFAKNVDASELRSVINNLQYATERILIPFYNTTNIDSLGVPEFLSLKESELEDFSIEKMKMAKSNLGYFFLEIFATFIGLSWGLISTILYNSDGTNGQM